MSAVTILGGLPRPPMYDIHGKFTAPWAAFFSSVQQLVSCIGNSGPTASRPTPTFVGQLYFDTTLGYLIACKVPAPAAVVWVNGAGAVV